MCSQFRVFNLAWELSAPLSQLPVLLWEQECLVLHQEYEWFLFHDGNLLPRHNRKIVRNFPALLQEREVEVLWECDLIALLWKQDQIKDHKKLSLLQKRNLLQRCET